MSLQSTPPGERVATRRLETFVRIAGPEDAPPLVLLHGNVSSSIFWSETIAAMAADHRVIAPDLRGFGDTERAAVDATRGLRDFTDDLEALLATLGVDGKPVHMVGWSLGGSAAMRYAIDHPQAIASLTLIAPGSPYGFGGTKGSDGAPCYPDYAGSGAGLSNPQLCLALAAGDRGEGSQTSPRNVMRTLYFDPSFTLPPALEDAFVEGMLATVISDDNYPGTRRASVHWPYFAPGDRGVSNAVSPKYCDLTALADLDPRPPIVWLRGSNDRLVADRALSDLGVLGEMGMIPGWPGPAVFPAQPMLAQTRAVLESYRANGGSFREEVFDGCGHGPHIERPGRWIELLRETVGSA
ncbi:MAG: alpha/beta fold hydrolase [Myxococcales bacterium]|nr:alpha/beta fold hydrolase [Myxococcales bacterium]